jgi:hypothetical protein
MKLLYVHEVLLLAIHREYLVGLLTAENRRPLCKNPFGYNFDSFWNCGFIWNAYWKTALRQSFWASTIYKKYEKNTNNKKNH